MKYSSVQYAKAFHDLAEDTPSAKRRGMIREFLAAVAKNGSLGVLPDFVRESEALADQQKKICRVTIRAPERLSESGVARKLHFRAKVKSERDVRLGGGGAVIEVNDLRVDNSVKMRMERVRQALTN